MLHLSDFVAGRKRFIISVGALYRSYKTQKEDEIWNTHSSDTSKKNVLILSRLSDFVTCSERFNIQIDWSKSQL